MLFLNGGREADFEAFQTASSSLKCCYKYPCKQVTLCTQKYLSDKQQRNKLSPMEKCKHCFSSICFILVIKSKIQQQAQKPIYRPGTEGQKPSYDKIASKMAAVVL